MQFAFLEQIKHDIAAANKFAIYIELGNGGPFRIFFDSFAHFWIGKHIKCGIVSHEVVENFGNLLGKSALGTLFTPLHEQHDTIILDQRID
ncbi:MAG: hypothetical protein BWZ03_00362 [bacterium ADurb.BinA186]|nr:MAG: hypothetical protein BWZ03_00362 [bacterium ADurb.BinA186]